MKLLTLIVIIGISANCFGQDIGNKMADIIKDQLINKQVDSTQEIIFLSRGSVLAPRLCINKRTGTIDSERGELKCGQLLINYDIGLMAGTHAASGNKNTFYWYDEKLFNGNKICIGLKKENDRWKLVMTIRSDADVRKEPANFWAEVKNADDAKQVVIIGFSYKPKD